MIGEISKGVEKLPKSKQKQELHSWLKEDLLVRFDGRIIPLDTEVLMEWRILIALLESTGITLPAIDSIGNCCLHWYTRKATHCRNQAFTDRKGSLRNTKDNFSDLVRVIACGLHNLRVH